MIEVEDEEGFNPNNLFLVSEDYKPSELSILTTEEKTKKVKSKTTGRTHLIKYQEATEYIDEYTGEILSREQALNLGVIELLLPAIKLQQEEILSRLRKEVREFAEFVLLFRNRRRGITPSIDVLCKMYAQKKGLRSDNVRKYIPRLKEGGILSNNTLLMPIWQIPGRSTKGSDHLSEEFEAEVKFARLLKAEEDAIKIGALSKCFPNF